MLEFLDKLFARHLIAGERLTLLGHSTGGLDIRWALEHWDKRQRVDGLVFMSVPHRGTNIADFAVRDLDTVLALAHDDAVDRGKTDSIFRLAYAACSAGPFRHRATIPWLPELGLGGAHAVNAWDNDGIVNTASMVCGETYLVPGDHADVIGHYAKLEGARPTGRTYEAYDLLRSAAGFADTTFDHIWRRVFAFATAS